MRNENPKLKPLVDKMNARLHQRFIESKQLKNESYAEQLVEKVKKEKLE